MLLVHGVTELVTCVSPWYLLRPGEVTHRATRHGDGQPLPQPGAVDLYHRGHVDETCERHTEGERSDASEVKFAARAPCQCNV